MDVCLELKFGKSRGRSPRVLCFTVSAMPDATLPALIEPVAAATADDIDSDDGSTDGGLPSNIRLKPVVGEHLRKTKNLQCLITLLVSNSDLE